MKKEKKKNVFLLTHNVVNEKFILLINAKYKNELNNIGTLAMYFVFETNLPFS